jgi:hypothetical protein
MQKLIILLLLVVTCSCSRVTNNPLTAKYKVVRLESSITYYTNKLPNLTKIQEDTKVYDRCTCKSGADWNLLYSIVE